MTHFAFDCGDLFLSFFFNIYIFIFTPLIKHFLFQE